MNSKRSLQPKDTIGRAEKVDLPELGFDDVPARIDTGASVSTIWASAIERGGGLDVTFFGEESAFYTGKLHHFKTFEQTEVRSSNGGTEMRYQIRTVVIIAGRRIRARFTLANRSTQLYPVLIGRNVLRGKFIVDVKLGEPLREAEKAHAAAVKARYARPAEEKQL